MLHHIRIIHYFHEKKGFVNCSFKSCSAANGSTFVSTCNPIEFQLATAKGQERKRCSTDSSSWHTHIAQLQSSRCIDLRLNIPLTFSLSFRSSQKNTLCLSRQLALSPTFALTSATGQCESWLDLCFCGSIEGLFGRAPKQTPAGTLPNSLYWISSRQWAASGAPSGFH